MIYEFYLPDIDFGTADVMTRVNFRYEGKETYTEMRDRIEFSVNGVQWTLRKLVSWDGNEEVVDVVINHLVDIGKPTEQGKFSENCVLQVDSESISENAAIDTAWDICWLLQLALGRRVRWEQRVKRTSSGREFVEAIDVNLVKGQGNHTITPNHNNGVIKSYLERAYPIYILNASWWRVTFDWISIAVQSGDIEHAGLVCSMLLDRISTLVLKDYKFPKQIDDEMEPKLSLESDEGKLLHEEIGRALSKVSTKWTSERTEVLIKVIAGWNDQPSYPNKIKAVFAEVGLPVPDKKLLQNRHKLAHEGKLGSDVIPDHYYKAITELVITLLLKMLNYSGKYFVLGVGEKSL